MLAPGPFPSSSSSSNETAHCTLPTHGTPSRSTGPMRPSIRKPERINPADTAAAAKANGATGM